MLTPPGYERLDVLGRGGFGVVYRARQVTIDREVAVKVDSRVILDDRDQRRFLREVRAAGRLSGHPNVVEIYDAGVLPDGHPYLVMELCPGGSLAGRGPLRPPDVAGIGSGIADALATAHGLGVLHRDIKPGNILIKRYGTVGLSDFGLAALIDQGRDSSVTLAALTPAYAAPEAFHLHPPTPQSDIYALGATLYALLAGRPPRFPAGGADPSVPEIIRLHDAPVPDLPGVPPELTAVLRRSLAKEPGWRYPDAAAFRDDLARFAGRSQVSTTVPVLPPPVAPQPGAWSGAGSTESRPGGRNRRAVLLSGVALVVVLALIGVWYFAVRDDPGAQGGGAASSGGSATLTTSQAPDPAQTFGIETVVDRCPAAGVAGGQARCAKRAECWSGIVVIQGELTSIRKLPCEQKHAYETYAIALVPPDVADPYLDVLEANPTVAKVCAKEVLLASRFGEALKLPATKWEPQVLPPTPDDRKAERNVYRCVGTLTEEDGSQGSAFRPSQ
ncbi:MAG TPA: serine/threonine-protein kinase [Actinophytocola sp.]|uniref:serine/threonine-protein kinase n=1 Tax=Actinophytocola sp. TaxID=1872138 RepID=UPI002DF98303|nr:serine/threonine-protein kinase [Actinophytocola sp.]